MPLADVGWVSVQRSECELLEGFHLKWWKGIKQKGCASHGKLNYFERKGFEGCAVIDGTRTGTLKVKDT